MNTLVLIPARGGSKGVPGKNIKPLAGKPLICYTIDIARQLVPDEYICVSTDDEAIMAVAANYGLRVPFKRPAALATDHAGTDEVIVHALEYYKSKNYFPDTVILLQPTSPLRSVADVQQALHIFSSDVDMVIGVTEADANPYYLLMEEDETGFLRKSKTLDNITRRQDAPKVYKINGAVYIINVESFLKHGSLSKFDKVIKSEMNKISSVDIDDMVDWVLCESLLEKRMVQL